MSGGSFNYAYSRLNDFADEAEMKIATNNAPNRWGECYGMPQPVLTEMSKMVKEARALAIRMHAAEWLYSGDISEETFLKRVAESRQ